MAWIKVFHFMFVFIWVGSLMTLTRMMIKHHTYEAATREVMANLYSRIYYVAQLPSMVIAVTLGMILISSLDQSGSMGWFHMKISLAMMMIMCDVVCSRFVTKLQAEGSNKGVHVLHGVSGLLLVGIAVSLYVVRAA